MSGAHLLWQVCVILATARALAWLLGRLGQPPVIGEMIAGIVLGPVVFGALAPGWHAALFPPDGLAALGGLSQIGLVLFMFIVGAELRAPASAGAQLRAAAWVGVPGVLVPMLLGFAIAPLLHPTLAGAGVGLFPFALFLAAAMAITAFPILARILKERGMTHTPLGQLSLSSAALADVLAWIALAAVVGLMGAGQGWSALGRMLAGLGVLAALGFGVLRPWLARRIARAAPDGRPQTGLLGVLLIGTFAMAGATEWLGLHAVFGAFLFGACLPRDDRLLASLIERLQHIAIVVLMPMFFALAGLRTSADAFGGAGLPALGLILLVAVAGKVLGAGAGARIAGLGWREAFAVGALMNARALMELIVMQVGLDAGVIGSELFTMLMVMAIATTLVTAPLVDLFLHAGRRRRVRVAAD
ncbi:MAG: cation:proton antiporter [Xanthomonadales bacterium]|nr:cation:proton antiporter [Xanthomonadales bacterium]